MLQTETEIILTESGVNKIKRAFFKYNERMPEEIELNCLITDVEDGWRDGAPTLVINSVHKNIKEVVLRFELEDYFFVSVEK